MDSILLPNKVSEALVHLGWCNAMIEEMNALTDYGTWDLVRLLVGKKAIGCRWVFIVKVNLDGSIARLKAHLVAYAQTYGVDYSDTFPPVAKMTYVRLFIFLVSTYNWDLTSLILKMSFFMMTSGRGVYGVTSRVCCSGGR